ncbi:MAG: hypothetical protein U0800_23995 [Isosphaeraceae bacterium]
MTGFFAAAMAAGMLATAADGLPDGAASLDPGRSARVEIPAPGRERTLTLVISLEKPGSLPAGVPVRVTVAFGGTRLAKSLHLGDPDVVWTVRQPAGVRGSIELEPAREVADPLRFAYRVAEVGEPAEDGVDFEFEDNDTPVRANPLRLGRTVYGWADDRPYLPLGNETTDAERDAGQDWFRFEVASDEPILAFFGLEFIDRDVPPDVRVYRLQDSKPVEYLEGIDPQASQREKPPRPGANKFTTRVLTKGTYFVRVDSCQPDYQLRTKVFPVPKPPSDADLEDSAKVAEAARRAIRTAMDFQLAAGDSWHANTPRKGHPLDRVSNVHHETSTCVACHPTHFTTQSALTAVRNGYKVEEPFALQFLIERLSNNPVPLHGEDEAVWARMIPAPANVLGRLSTITMDFERLIGGPPRDTLHREIGAFLKIYYDGRKTIPPDESNGNNPVSRYKVAADSWRQLNELARRTWEARFAETRDTVASLLPTGEPSHMRDLAAQTIGLCQAGPDRFERQIHANVKRLLDLQRPDGQWAIPFDPKDPKGGPSQMQTGECLYALALSGLTADHPAVRKGVVALLKEQKPFGGWLDTNPYEQFRTPFRETQWSLMALAQLYPGPGTRGWDGPLGPQPESLRTDSVSKLVADLERIWDPPSAALHEQIQSQLVHESPLVRLAACSTLARIGASGDTAALAARLGDESKAVSRAASEALRLIGNRLNGQRWSEDGAAHAEHADAESRALGNPVQAEREITKGRNVDRRYEGDEARAEHARALVKALNDPNERVRRGATRIFAAHFRELSAQSTIADALLEKLDDADPIVQMQAIRGLWRWWYWRADADRRGRIEDRFIARLAEPTHPWVRRNLTEALYILADENVRYLFGNWVPSLADEAVKRRITVAQHATANRLAGKYVAVLTGGSPYHREGILRAIAEFRERPDGKGRVGNDIEPPIFYDEALGTLANALIGQLDDPDPTIRRLALESLITVRGHRDPALSAAILARKGDDDAEVREWAGTMSAEFPLKIQRGKPTPFLLETVDALLASKVPGARAAGLDVLGQVGAEAPGVERSDRVVQGLNDPDAPVRAAALRALTASPKLLERGEIRGQVVASLAEVDPDARIQALRLILDRKSPADERDLRRALDDDTPSHRLALLDAIVGSKAYASDLRLIGVVGNSVTDDNSGVREKALQVVQKHPGLVENPAVEEGLRELSRSDNVRQKEIATSLLKTRGRSSGGLDGAELLDLAFFESKILPILDAPGDDGESCIGCHRSHTILRIIPPGPDKAWNPAAVRSNYRAALRVVNLTDPSSSLLLGKPTWEAAEEAEAQSDPTKKAHAGGIRFEKGSPEYQAILDWINGARLRPEGQAGGSR